MPKKKSKKINIDNEFIEADNVQTFLNKHNISAILLIPNFGVFSCFQSEGDKLEILEQAKMEDEIRTKLMDAEVGNQIQDNFKYFRKKHKQTPEYVK